MRVHPVIELLRARAATGSKPGARADPERLALVVEGGGMRAVASCAMTEALERGGLTSCFDFVVGCSAGALNAAAFLAGVAGGCRTEYSGAFASRRFINPYRLLLGKPAVDVDYALDLASQGLDAHRHERTIASPIPLHCIATDVETTEAVALTDLRTLPELRQALLASSRLPWVGGQPVEFRGRRWLDGGLIEALPLDTALRLGATHVLVLQTRPEGVHLPSFEGFADRLAEDRLRAHNPRLVERYRERGRAYEQLTQEILRMEREPRGAPPFVLGLRPPATAPTLGMFERRAEVVRAVAEASLHHAMQAVVSPALAAPGRAVGATG
ncbi:patatin-like phospholipase family protein [Archangium gephyra]|uniref:patatin-like phospholipase family protein n=1 Tax=Archangium gephyra TaxID=48 RepID=UPI0035D42469